MPGRPSLTWRNFAAPAAAFKAARTTPLTGGGAMAVCTFNFAMCPTPGRLMLRAGHLATHLGQHVCDRRGRPGMPVNHVCAVEEVAADITFAARDDWLHDRCF